MSLSRPPASRVGCSRKIMSSWTYTVALKTERLLTAIASTAKRSKREVMHNSGDNGGDRPGMDSSSHNLLGGSSSPTTTTSSTIGSTASRRSPDKNASSAEQQRESEREREAKREV